MMVHSVLEDKVWTNNYHTETWTFTRGRTDVGEEEEEVNYSY